MKKKQNQKAAEEWVPDRTYKYEELLCMDTIKKGIYHRKVIMENRKTNHEMNQLRDKLSDDREFI